MSTYRNPFAKRRPNPKRRTPRRVGNGREILRGAAKTARRREIFERSGGHCEAQIGMGLNGPARRCNEPITWETMEWSHKAHGARKSDSMSGGIASCRACHRNIHNAGGKPCPRKPGSVMKIKDAKEYWSGKVCFCDGPKKPAESFCPECLMKLTGQTRYTVQHADNPDDYRQALAQAEIEILQWKAPEATA